MILGVTVAGKEFVKKCYTTTKTTRKREEMAVARWQKFKTSMKEKRAVVGVGKAGRVDEILRKEDLVVQRLSSDVSGKQ